MKTLVIDPGHPSREGDTGAVGHGVVEAEWTLKLAYDLFELLVPWPVSVELTRWDEDPIGLMERGALSEKCGADLVISIHANAAANESASGMLTFHWPENLRGQLVARTIAERAPDGLRGYRTPWRAATPGDWDRVRNVLRFHGMTSVLVEAGYVTNAGDAEILRSDRGRRQIAAAILAGVAAWL